MKWDTQKGIWFKKYELIISGIFHLMVLDHGWPLVAETVNEGWWVYVAEGAPVQELHALHTQHLAVGTHVEPSVDISKQPPWFKAF